jgi:hypothetical protein
VNRNDPDTACGQPCAGVVRNVGLRVAARGLSNDVGGCLFLWASGARRSTEALGRGVGGWRLVTVDVYEVRVGHGCW